jgi:hypothetical protein
MTLFKIAMVMLLSLLGLQAQALSFNVPKMFIDSAIQKKFPINKYTLNIDKPTLSFRKELQKISLCGTWSNSLAKIQGDFCVNLKPVWNKSVGEVQISNLNIEKFNTQDGHELPSHVSQLLNTTILKLLDGKGIYHMPEMIGKHLENIEVDENSIKLIF